MDILYGEWTRFDRDYTFIHFQAKLGNSVSSEAGSTLIGKNLLPLGANSFLLE